MYIERLELSSIRTFLRATRKNALRFVHPDDLYLSKSETGVAADSHLLPRPRLPNVNLLLGENGSGKSTVLRAIALATLGPAASQSGLRDPGLVRLDGNDRGEPKGTIRARFLLHPQDGAAVAGQFTDSLIEVRRRGELDIYEFLGDAFGVWSPVFESGNDKFFVAGYGATRRVEPPENLDMGARARSSFSRAQRIQSLFQDSFSLVPLGAWLPRLRRENKGRYTQVVHLLDRLLKPARYAFSGEQAETGDYLFEARGMKIPFQALSDGFRAFIGWVADMLYHVCFGTPSGKKLVDSSGIVMVDEIDLHLHPRWQMKVIPTVARALPRIQFILTSHSPLVASSLEWMNIITLKNLGKANRTRASRLRRSIHGLNSDQVLVSDFFGLPSTRAAEKRSRLNALTIRARNGDDEAAKQVIAELARGTEDEPR